MRRYAAAVAALILVAVLAPLAFRGAAVEARPSALYILQNAVVTTTNGSILPLVNYNTAVVQTVGTFTGTITFEGTVDGATWIAVALADLGSTTRARSTTATATGKLYMLEDAGGLTMFRARISTYTGGTFTVKARAWGP